MQLAIEIFGLCVLFGGVGYGAAIIQEKIAERKAEKHIVVKPFRMAGCNCFYCKD
jgi:hypothetical protein